jgi:hypothetical protein
VGILAFGTSSTERLRIDASGNIKQNSVNTSTNVGYAVNNGTYDAIALGTGGFGVNGGAATDGGIRAYNNLLFGTGASSTERLRIDAGGSVLIGKTTPADLHDTWNHIIIGEKGAIISTKGGVGLDGITLADNAYVDSDTGNYAYQTTGAASQITQTGGAITFSNAASGSAGAALTPVQTMAINPDRKVDVGGVANQTVAVLNARFNGAAIEFGHGNNGAGYYGTAGSYGNNGHPYIGFSCDSEESVNTFTTRGAKGNIITGDLSGNLTFAQVTTASATGQTPVNRMTLDHAGRFIVGNTSAFDSSSFCVDQSGLGQFRRDGTPLIVRRDGSVGALISFEDDGANVGSIGTAAGPVAYIVLNDAATDNVAALKGASGAILPSTNAGADKDGTMNLGSSGARFESLYLSGGVVFGDAGGSGTPTSNTFDSYEEGTSTILLSFNTTNATITQGNTFVGYYTKVGNVCTVVGYTGTRSFETTGAGNPRFSGLPFASKSGTYGIVNFTHNTFFTNSTAGYVENSTNYFYPITDNGTGVAPIAGTGTRYLMFSVTYLTA